MPATLKEFIGRDPAKPTTWGRENFGKKVRLPLAKIPKTQGLTPSRVVYYQWREWTDENVIAGKKDLVGSKFSWDWNLN